MEKMKTTYRVICAQKMTKWLLRDFLFQAIRKRKPFLGGRI
jgi:hypothetical protein